MRQQLWVAIRLKRSTSGIFDAFSHEATRERSGLHAASHIAPVLSSLMLRRQLAAKELSNGVSNLLHMSL